MPIQLKWLDHERGVEFIGSGVVTGIQCIDANQQVIDDPRLPQLLFQIVDLSDLEKFEVDAKQSQTLAAMDDLATKIVKEVRVAMICPDDLVFGMSRLYAGHTSSDWPVSVFRTRTEAEVWLGTSAT